MRPIAVGVLFFTLPLLAQEPPRFRGKPTEHYVKQLESKDAAERVKAVEALVVLSAEVPAAGVAVVKALRDEDPRVRLTALKVVARTGAAGKDAIPVLTATLTDSDRQFRYLAADALAKLGPDKRAVPGLVAFLKSADNEGIWHVAAKALGKAGAEAVPALAEALKDPSPVFRQQVMLALREAGPEGKAAVPALIAALKTSAAISLPDHVPGQYRFLGKEGNFQREVMAVLPLIGAPAVPELVAALKDPNPIVRYALVVALRGLGPAEKVVPAHVELLKEKDFAIRKAAIANLIELGPAAKDAVPALKELAARDPEVELRESAQRALGKIQPPK